MFRFSFFVCVFSFLSFIFLYPVHHLEDVFVLDRDVQVHIAGDFVELFLNLFHVDCRVGDIGGHGHHETLFHDPLADVHDVDVGLGHGHRDPRDDADPVGPRDGDDAYLRGFLFCLFRGHMSLPLNYIAFTGAFIIGICSETASKNVSATGWPSFLRLAAGCGIVPV